MRRLLLLAAALLLSSAAASAQELAIFDLNDFVDPRQLGAVPVSPRRFGCPCTTVLVTRVLTGWDHEYINVTRATRTEVAFAHVATSVYRGPWQLNAKLSVLQRLEQLRTTNILRPSQHRALVLQAAYYLRGPGSSSLRTQLSWRGTQDNRGAHDAHELGAEVDTQVKVFGHYLEGSLIFTTIVGSRRDQDEEESSRLGYVQRFPRLRLGAIRVDPSLTAGLLGDGVNFGNAGRLNLQPKIHASLPLKIGGVNLNVIYGPSYARLQPPPRVVKTPAGQIVVTSPVAWQSYHEVAIFIDVPVLLRSF
jgi:hypothetical protein